MKLDSFKVLKDQSYRGTELIDLLNLKWLDSLIDRKAASLNDFRYIINSLSLFSGSGGHLQSPLAGEIRVKYVEQIQKAKTSKFLRIYIEETNDLKDLDQNTNEAIKKLHEFIMKTDPYLKFDRQDSLLFYSKEFIWKYKEVVKSRKFRYSHLRWLAQHRLRQIVGAMNSELVDLGVGPDPNADCAEFDFKKRFHCEYGEIVGEITSIPKIMARERADFLLKRNKGSP